VPTIATLLALAVPVIANVAIPGAAVLFVVSNASQMGRSAGVCCACGIAGGTMGHVLIATAGLSALVVAAPVPFAVAKLAGAGYLFWLGASRLNPHAAPSCVVLIGSRVPKVSLLGRGLRKQLGNYNAFLFVMALLPQFVTEPGHGTARQMLVLGMVLMAIQLTAHSLFAMGSIEVGRWLQRNPQANLQCGRVSGAINLVLGTLAAISAMRLAM
jgi:threonine/homoserine/homoserine lactone efflux protein